MRGVNGKRKWVLLLAAVCLVLVAGVVYVDLKTDQMMGLASGEIIEVLEPHVIDIPEETEPEKVTEVTDLSEYDTEGVTPSDGQAVSSGDQTKLPAAAPQKPASESSSNGTNQVPENTTDISAEEATLIEKAQAYKLASSKLSAKEINALIQWSQGGFSEKEKESAKSLFYSRFSEEEQQWILGLFKKYN